MGSTEPCMEAKSIRLGNPPSARDEGGVPRIAQMVARVMDRVETSDRG